MLVAHSHAWLLIALVTSISALLESDCHETQMALSYNTAPSPHVWIAVEQCYGVQRMIA